MVPRRVVFVFVKAGITGSAPSAATVRGGNKGAAKAGRISVVGERGGSEVSPKIKVLGGPATRPGLMREEGAGGVLARERVGVRVGVGGASFGLITRPSVTAVNATIIAAKRRLTTSIARIRRGAIDGEMAAQRGKVFVNCGLPTGPRVKAARRSGNASQRGTTDGREGRFAGQRATRFSLAITATAKATVAISTVTGATRVVAAMRSREGRIPRLRDGQRGRVISVGGVSQSGLAADVILLTTVSPLSNRDGRSEIMAWSAASTGGHAASSAGGLRCSGPTSSVTIATAAIVPRLAKRGTFGV